MYIISPVFPLVPQKVLDFMVFGPEKSENLGNKTTNRCENALLEFFLNFAACWIHCLLLTFEASKKLSKSNLIVIFKYIVSGNYTN